MRLIWGILFFLMLSDTAYAISPITIHEIKEAQYYGKMNVHNPLDVFLQPWVSYEEKAEKLTEVSEHACLYTPFLLIATDAREKSLKGQSVKVGDSEKVLNDYSGTLSFSVVLFGNEPYFGKRATVVLIQDKEMIKAYEVAIPMKGEMVSGDSEKLAFRLQCYFYFWDKKIAPDKPMTLSIVTSDQKEHHFYFSNANIK